MITKLRFFDFEVFPNWWCCTFGDLPDHEQGTKTLPEEIKKTFIVVRSDKAGARDKLLNLMKEDGVCVVGYNIKHYDLIIANAIYQGLQPYDVRIINDLIINPSTAWSTKDHLRLQPLAKKKIPGVVYQDLLDDSSGSLKEKEAILGLNVLESAVDFEKENLTDEDKEDVIFYNKQDVYASMIYYLDSCESYVNQKLAVCKRFNIPEATGYACTNAKLVEQVLKCSRSTFIDADRLDIELPQNITDYCREWIPSGVLTRLLSSPDSFEAHLFNNTVSYGNGGIHSVYNPTKQPTKLIDPVYVSETEDFALVNVDAASYYPSMLIQFNCLSRAVHNKQGFIDIFEERMRIKHKENQTHEDYEIQMADKLILNTTFGASGNKYLGLYDPYMCTKVCRIGQIFLTALAMKIHSKIPLVKIIQTNTDGILVYIKRSNLPILKNLMDEWTKLSGIKMELDSMKAIWQLNVNNYIMIDDKDHVKSRGAWLQSYYQRGGSPTVSPRTGFVIPKAVISWLTEGKDIMESIVKNNNIGDFVMTTSKGVYKKALMVYPDGREEELFKCNRYVATKDEKAGRIYKFKTYKGRPSYTIVANCPEHVKLVNDDLRNYNFSDIKKELDYMYYIMRAIEKVDVDFLAIIGVDEYITDQFKYKI